MTENFEKPTMFRRLAYVFWDRKVKSYFIIPILSESKLPDYNELMPISLSPNSLVAKQLETSTRHIGICATNSSLNELQMLSATSMKAYDMTLDDNGNIIQSKKAEGEDTESEHGMAFDILTGNTDLNVDLYSLFLKFSDSPDFIAHLKELSTTLYVAYYTRPMEIL